MRSSGMPRSTPAQKARPSARTITTRISSSKRRRSACAVIWRADSQLHAFSFSGWFSTIHASGGSRTSSIRDGRSLMSACYLEGPDLSACTSGGRPIAWAAHSGGAHARRRIRARGGIGSSARGARRAGVRQGHSVRRPSRIGADEPERRVRDLLHRDPVPRFQRDPARSLREGLRLEREEAAAQHQEAGAPRRRSARALRDPDPPRKTGVSSRELELGTDQVRCRIDGRVAVVTLNRPEARNALTQEIKDALRAVIPALGDDPDVGCVLLTGAGGAFCAGGDTKVMAEGPPPEHEPRVRMLRREHEISAAIHRLTKPVIAALPGPAAGAGFALALACDLRIFADSAFVTTAYARLGLSGDYGASWFLTQLVGPALAREIMFTSARLDARECARLGLANRVVPDADLERASLAWARELAAGPPIALRYMKDNLNRALVADLQSCLDAEAERMVAGAFTEDSVEAGRAFTEKRPPQFRGR